jgi:hypothetical protein
MPKPKKTIATPTAGPRQETKQICLILQPTTETGPVVCVSIIGSFEDENQKGFDIPLHNLWMKQPVKLATLFPDPDLFACVTKNVLVIPVKKIKSLCCAALFLSGGHKSTRVTCFTLMFFLLMKIILKMVIR